MGFPTKLNQLCTPAYIYFIISMIGLVVSGLQNIGNNYTYSLGIFSCPVPSCLALFIIKIIYVLFWTWILNLICGNGHKEIAWFLLLFPIILLFLLIGIGMIYQQNKHSHNKHSHNKHSHNKHSHKHKHDTTR